MVWNSSKVCKIWLWWNQAYHVFTYLKTVIIKKKHIILLTNVAFLNTNTAFKPVSSNSRVWLKYMILQTKLKSCLVSTAVARLKLQIVHIFLLNHLTMNDRDHFGYINTTC